MPRGQFDLFGEPANAQDKAARRGQRSRSPDSPITERLLRSSVEIQTTPEHELTFQHTVFCQTAMPYRYPGDVRRWERTNGRVSLEMEAGRALDPRTRKFGPVPLPFGSRPRLILMHLNSVALRSGDPTIEVEDSLTAFVRTIIGRPPTGRDIGVVRDQLTALSAALVRLGITDGRRAFQIDAKVVDAFDLWAPENPEQKILWPSVVRLSQRYFESLVKHAVPLDERAIAALANSALALDLYTWLAQRLHRIDPGRPQFIPWTALQSQFGFDYRRIRDFRRKFLHTLGAVSSQYPNAKIAADGRGVTLRHSSPPVSGRSPQLIEGGR